MQRALRPRSGNVCSENKGIMCVCWNRANERCSSWSPGMIFKTTSRSASAGSTARYVFPGLRISPKWTELLTNFGEIRSPGKGPQQAITAKQQFEFSFPLGEPGRDLSGDHLLSRFTAKTDFLVHQPDRFLRAQFGVLLQEFFNGDLLTARPGGRHRPDLARDPLALRPAATH